MPLENWRLFHEKSDLRYFQINIKDCEVVTDSHLLAWFNICDQITNEFGQNKSYINYLNKKKKFALKLVDYLETGDRFNMNKANIAKIDMDSIIEEAEALEIRDGIIAIQKYMGFSQGLNEKTMSVKEYHCYLDSIRSYYGKAS